MLDSDTANADSNLICEFYSCTQPPHVVEVFVRIMVPGDKTNIIETIAREHHKRRFPRQWLHYQMQNDGSAMIGTPLQDWANACPEDINDYQLAELGILKFQTVEQIGTMSDSQAQKVGMGGIGLREKARQFLNTKNRKANSSEVDELRLKHEAEMAEMKAQLAALAAKFGDTNVVAMEPPKRRGRPPNNPEV